MGNNESMTLNNWGGGVGGGVCYRSIIKGLCHKIVEHFLVKHSLPGPHTNRLKRFREICSFCEYIGEKQNEKIEVKILVTLSLSAVNCVRTVHNVSSNNHLGCLSSCRKGG